ncbi:hypothetical protein VTJ49DRAFT_528 [Mycothermus thermophilus]|uniref:Uncharacterized protein n=1 Tax=Humicola insolens TaxID=85995 RepID=A0ABR3VFH6_HUMIN
MVVVVVTVAVDAAGRLGRTAHTVTKGVRNSSRVQPSRSAQAAHPDVSCGRDRTRRRLSQYRTRGSHPRARGRVCAQGSRGSRSRRCGNSSIGQKTVEETQEPALCRQRPRQTPQTLSSVPPLPGFVPSRLESYRRAVVFGRKGRAQKVKS